MARCARWCCRRRSRWHWPRRRRARATAGSPRKFVAATYTHGGVHTQSVRFVTGGYSYRVFTASGPKGRLDAGVDVRDLRSGKVTTVACAEAPRFYIHDLEGLVPCDPDTPVGVACVR